MKPEQISTLQQKVVQLTNEVQATLLDRQTLFQGHFINVLEERYLLPNHHQIKREKIVKNHGKNAVLIVALTKEYKYLLVSQNRIHQITSIEFPAGYIESGETAVTAAIRELQEETGYVAEQIHILDQYYPALSIDASMITIIFAKGCVKTTEQNLGAEEYIKYQEFSEAEVAWLIDHKKILGGGTKLAFALIQLLLKKDNQK